MSSCSVFNPFTLNVRWSLNGIAQEPIPGTNAGLGYLPNSRQVHIAKHDDGEGYFILEGVNTVMLTYPADEVGNEKTYAYTFQVPSRVSVDDDLILYCLRSELMLVDTDGFVLIVCNSSSLSR